MLSAPVYLAVPHPLQHFPQGHALPGHICRKHPAIAVFLDALYLALSALGYMPALFPDICVSIFLLLW